MADPSIRSISEGRSRVNQPPTVGYSDDTSTSQETVDLSSWEGQVVRIQVIDQVHYVAFMADASTVLDLDDAALGTVGVPIEIAAGASEFFVVPKDRPFLRYAAKASTGRIRVIIS